MAMLVYRRVVFWRNTQKTQRFQTLKAEELVAIITRTIGAVYENLQHLHWCNPSESFFGEVGDDWNTD